MGRTAFMHSVASFRDNMRSTDRLVSAIKDAYRNNVITYDNAARKLREADCCEPEIREALAA